MTMQAGLLMARRQAKALDRGAEDWVNEHDDVLLRNLVRHGIALTEAMQDFIDRLVHDSLTRRDFSATDAGPSTLEVIRHVSEVLGKVNSMVQAAVEEGAAVEGSAVLRKGADAVVRRYYSLRRRWPRPEPEAVAAAEERMKKGPDISLAEAVRRMDLGDRP